MIQVSKITKSYSKQVLFEDVNFSLSAGERVGLIGRNGEGKSTLFKLILGQEDPDEGMITSPKNYSMGHLTQHISFTHPTVIDEACSAFEDVDRIWTERYKVEIILNGLGFSEEQLYLSPDMLSGGFQVRLLLGKVLIAEPQLLLLDEPTNYLDIVSIRWLREFLRNWPNELMIITHDRDFMDSVTTHTMIVHRRKVKKIAGNTEKIYDQIAQEEEIYEQTRQNEQIKRQQLEKFISRFRAKASKARAVQSRVKALEKREKLEELSNIKTLDFEFNAAQFPGKWLMHVEDIGFAYQNSQKLIEAVSFSVAKGDRIGVIGPNGRGKTTFLNLLASELKPSEGKVVLSDNLRLGYFGQTNVDRLNPKKTIEEEVMSVHPTHSRGVARNICGVMMFEGDAGTKKISVLSGGERSRVLLAKILVTPSNMLLLDEPTNHLDMDSIDSLVEALEVFQGGVIMVTHSELMLHALATRLIIFDGGKVSLFEGGYQDFLDRVGWNDETARGVPASPTRVPESGEKKKSKKRVSLERQMKSLEEKVMSLEDVIAKNTRDLVVASEKGDSAAISKLSKHNHDTNAEIERLFEELTEVSREISEEG